MAIVVGCLVAMAPVSAEIYDMDFSPNRNITSMRHVLKSQSEFPSPLPLEVVESKGVDGGLPTWLNGDLFMNVPAKYEWGNKSYNHVFDATAMTRRFRIRHDDEGQMTVDFMQRYLRSNSFLENSAEDDVVITELFTLGQKAKVTQA